MGRARGRGGPKIDQSVGAEYWNSVHRAAEQETSRHSDPTVRGVITAVNADGTKAKIRRDYNTAEDGIFYPIARNFDPPKLGERVYARQTIGGLVIENRIQKGADKKITDMVHRDGSLAMTLGSNVLNIERPGGDLHVKMKDTGSSSGRYRYLGWWRSDDVRVGYMGVNPSNQIELGSDQGDRVRSTKLHTAPQFMSDNGATLSDRSSVAYTDQRDNAIYAGVQNWTIANFSQLGHSHALPAHSHSHGHGSHWHYFDYYYYYYDTKYWVYNSGTYSTSV